MVPVLMVMVVATPVMIGDFRDRTVVMQRVIVVMPKRRGGNPEDRAEHCADHQDAGFRY